MSALRKVRRPGAGAEGRGLAAESAAAAGSLSSTGAAYPRQRPNTAKPGLAQGHIGLTDE